MHFNWKKTYLKPVAALGSVIVLFLMSGAKVAHAAFSWWDLIPPVAAVHAVKAIAGGAVNSAISFITSGIVAILVYIFSWIAGVFIALEVWIIQVVLATTLSVVNLGIVQTGFSVTLSVANLGFVLGIIIVALATILRRESYGIKTILWKLVVMAILINFILIIVAPILSFSNSITNYFLASFPGGGNGVAGFHGFANSIVNALKPQQLVAPENNPGAQKFQSSAGDLGVGLGTLVGGSLGSVLAAIASLSASTITLFLIVIVLGVFVLMLLLRFAYLVFLCIVAPFPWMLWIFPKTSKYFSQWWDTFIRWAFFPPIVMFFMWLVVGIGANNGDAGMFDPVAISNATNASGIDAFLKGLGMPILLPIVATGLIDFVLILLMMGGMYVANKMSITGASMAMSAAKGVGDRVKGYAAKRGKKIGRAGFRKMGGVGFVQRMRTGEFGAKLKNIPLVGGALHAGVQRVAGNVGRAVQPHLDNKDLVDEATKNVPKDSKIILENLKNESMILEDKFAHLEALQKQGLLAPDTVVGDTTAKDFFDKYSDVKMLRAKVDAGGRPIIDPNTGKHIEDPNAREINVGGDGTTRSYGQGKLAYDADRNFLSDKPIRDLRREVDRLAGAGKDTSKALEALDAATKRFLTEDLIKGDGKKVNVNSVFAKSDYYTQALMGNMSQFATHLISGMLPNAKSGALKNVEESYQKAIMMAGDARSIGQLKDPTQRAALPDAVKEKWNIKAVYGALAGNVLFAPLEEAAATAATPPPAGGKTP